MSTVKEFGETAKSLARNPLGIIALFIVLIYGFASLVVGASDQLQDEERYLIVVFMTGFPVIVLGVFSWLVAQHHEKLYAPKDYKNDESFLRGISGKNDGRPALKELDGQIESKIGEVLESEDIQESLEGEGLKEKLSDAANKITTEIRKTSFITIDARKFTGKDIDVFELPIGAFSTFGDLTDEIFYLIESHVGPFEYGYSWVIRNPRDHSIIKNSRMIAGIEPGEPLPDERTLEEVGIQAGMVLYLTAP